MHCLMDDPQVQAVADLHQVGRDEEPQREVHQLDSRLHLHLQADGAASGPSRPRAQADIHVDVDVLA